jgi:hypothetical protein
MQPLLTRIKAALIPVKASKYYRIGAFASSFWGVSSSTPRAEGSSFWKSFILKAGAAALC